MKCRATIKIKIPKRKELMDISTSYLKACQYASDTAFKHKCKHKFDLHHIVYKQIRKRFNLKSQFAINTIAKGFEAYKSCGKKAIFKSVPVRYDRRNSSFHLDKINLSGIKNIPLNIPEYYWKYLDWNYQTADMVILKDKLFLNITFSRDINALSSSAITVGVDVGINNLAVTSDGKVFKGCKTKIKQFQYLRSKLQAKGTKSAKRLLRKVSGRQKRYMAWVNHNVSKIIVSSADTIALENLKGIRKSRNKFMGKRFNRWLNSWSFYQLQQFIRYKAEREGKRVVFVKPYMTSQICSHCGTVGSRYFDFFSCLHCGFSLQSDFNASCNLRRLSVTQPYSSCDDGKGSIEQPSQSIGLKATNFN